MANRFTKKVWIVPLALSLLVAVVWSFPGFWYTEGSGEKGAWFAERSEVAGWNYTAIPIEKSAERILVADRTVNGEFVRGDESVRVFSAKRFQEKSNEIGLFVHTPDRCWVESGWRIEPAAPEVREVTVHGVKLAMERRIFRYGAERELVYFCGLVGGETLPYRLDHNLSVGRKAGQTMARATDTHFWGRLWTSFASRRDLSGPKQFIRISTPVRGELLEASDERLRTFLSQWLVPGDYERERAALKTVAAR